MSNRRVYVSLLAIAAAALALLSGSGPASGAKAKHVVAARYNALLERKVLTTTRGLTLYSLGIEMHGRFACRGTCLKTWSPLQTGAGTKPTGPAELGTVKRPDSGRTQVTYHGMPLYTFSGDSAPGQANGNGITDVGRWHVAALPTAG